MQTASIIPTVTTGTVKLLFDVMQYKKVAVGLLGSFKIRKGRNANTLFDHLAHLSKKNVCLLLLSKLT